MGPGFNLKHQETSVKKSANPAGVQYFQTSFSALRYKSAVDVLWKEKKGVGGNKGYIK